MPTRGLIFEQQRLMSTQELPGIRAEGWRTKDTSNLCISIYPKLCLNITYNTLQPTYEPTCLSHRSPNNYETADIWQANMQRAGVEH